MERLRPGLDGAPFQRRKCRGNFAVLARFAQLMFHMIAVPMGQIGLAHDCNNSAADW